MMKLFITSIAGAMLLLAAGTGARADMNCSGLLTGVIPGNVTVPNGATCDMTNVQISGNVNVQNNATLVVTGAIIGGNVQGSNCSGLILSDNPPFPLTVYGDVQIHNCINTSTRNLGINAGTATVAGSFTCQNNSGNLTCIANDVMFGKDVQVTNNTFSSGVIVTNNHIVGNLSVNNNTGPGGSASSPALIMGNTILGNFTCQNNIPPPSGSGNVVSGNNQCPYAP